MTDAQLFLIELLRLGLGLEHNKHSFPRIIGWHEVVKEVKNSGLEAIASDGLQRLYVFYPELFSFFNSKQFKFERNQWFGKAIITEREYQSHLNNASRLAELYKNIGIRTLVLKGFSVSQYYPIPSHRPSCDFDCFLLNDSSHTDAFEHGNSLMSSLGICVNDSYYKNSEFDYYGLHVENHRFCCSVKRGRRVKALESFLQQILLTHSTETMNNTCLELPSVLFSSLFLLEHSLAHLLYGKIELKHICDWTVMKKKYNNLISGDEFNSICGRFGLLKYKLCLDGLADFIISPTKHVLLESERLLLLNAFTYEKQGYPSNKFNERLRKLFLMARSNWKFELYSESSLLQEVLNSSFGYFFVKIPKLS